jgi:HAD superfamily hydrolase (TIGR01549 family)
MKQDFTGIITIYFDTSDTLYTNENLEKAYPKKLTEMVAAKKGLSLDEAKELLEETAKKLEATENHVTKIRTAAELGFTPDEVYADAFDKVVPAEYLTKDALLGEFISGLSQNYKLGIISNLKRTHVVKVLEALGLEPDEFTYYVTLDVVREIKPAAEPFLKAIELAGHSADTCLYIGDSPTKDIRPAKEAGMKTVLISKDSTQNDIKFADAVVGDVRDLAGLLG